MPKADSNDLRERVMQACDQWERAAAVAKRFAVSESLIEKRKRRRRERGTVAPKTHAGGRQSLLAAQSERIRAQLQTKPDTTHQEWRDGLGLAVSLSPRWSHLRRLGLTFKKTLKAAEQERPDVRLERGCWQALPPLWDPAPPGVRG